MSSVFKRVSGAELQAFRRAYIGLALVALITCTMNTLTVPKSTANAISLGQAAAWNFTSGAAYLAFAWIAFVATRPKPVSPRGWPGIVFTQILASVVFSLLHFIGWDILRVFVYWLTDLPYAFRNEHWAKEYLQDLGIYLIAVGAFSSFGLQGQMRLPLRPSDTVRTFDIIDGTRLIRVPVAHILAVTSAGNYVEFILTDGRRPLMRATLNGTASALEPYGFIRTHRSWIVNRTAVTSLVAERSGDFAIGISNGIEVPLSRRFPKALESLRDSPKRGSD